MAYEEQMPVPTCTACTQALWIYAAWLSVREVVPRLAPVRADRRLDSSVGWFLGGEVTGTYGKLCVIMMHTFAQRAWQGMLGMLHAAQGTHARAIIHVADLGQVLELLGQVPVVDGLDRWTPLRDFQGVLGT